MNFTRTLQMQNPPLTGADVDQLQVWLQRFLGANKYRGEHRDGNPGLARIYGGMTANAVQEFKSDSRIALRPDRVVNRLTWDALKERNRVINPLQPVWNYRVRGKLELRDAHTGNKTPAKGFAIRLYQTGSNPRQPYGSGVTNGDGDFDFEFFSFVPIPQLPPPPPEDPPLPPPVRPALDVDVLISKGDVELRTVAHADAGGGFPGPATPVNVTLAPLLLHSVAGQFLYRTSPLSTGVQVSADSVKVYYHTIQNGVMSEVELVAAFASGPGSSYHFSYEWPPNANINEPKADIRVRAYRGAKIVGETPILFNVAAAEWDVNLDLPPDGVRSNPALNPPTGVSEFEILSDEVRGAADVTDLDVMAVALGQAADKARKSTIRYLAGDIAIDREVNPPPTNFDDVPAYEGKIDQLINAKTGPVDRTLRAWEMQAFASSYPTNAGQIIRDLSTCPLALTIPVYKQGDPLLEKTEALMLPILSIDAVPAHCFYALSTTANAGIPTYKLYDAAVMKAEQTQREELLLAHQDNVIRLSINAADVAKELEIALAKLSAIRKGAPKESSAPWGALWPIDNTNPLALTGDEQAIVLGLIADKGPNDANWWNLAGAPLTARQELEWKALCLAQVTIMQKIKGQTFAKVAQEVTLVVDSFGKLAEIRDEDTTIGGNQIIGLLNRLKEASETLIAPANTPAYLQYPERIGKQVIRGADATETANNLLKFIRSVFPLPNTLLSAKPLVPKEASASSKDDIIAFFQLAPPFKFKTTEMSQLDAIIQKICGGDAARTATLTGQLHALRCFALLGVKDDELDFFGGIADGAPNHPFQDILAINLPLAGANAIYEPSVVAKQSMIQSLVDLGATMEAAEILIAYGWLTKAEIQAVPEARYFSAFPAALAAVAQVLRA